MKLDLFTSLEDKVAIHTQLGPTQMSIGLLSLQSIVMEELFLLDATQKMPLHSFIVGWKQIHYCKQSIVRGTQGDKPRQKTFIDNFLLFRPLNFSVLLLDKQLFTQYFNGSEYWYKPYFIVKINLDPPQNSVDADLPRTLCIICELRIMGSQNQSLERDLFKAVLQICKM